MRLPQRSVLGAAVLVALLAACGGPSLDPLDADSCDELVETAVAIVTTVSDSSEGQSLEDFDQSREDLRTDLATVGERAVALGCALDADSDSYRRGLADLDHDPPRRAEVIVDGALFDPFLR